MCSTDTLRTVVPRLLGSTLLVVLVSVWGLGCDSGGGNEDMDMSPTVENQIQDQRSNAGGEVIEIDLGQVFSSPSGGVLTYSASSSEEAVASVAVNGAMLTVTPGEGGEAEIRVRASNDQGEATETFGVRVFADPPTRP